MNKGPSPMGAEIILLAPKLLSFSDGKAKIKKMFKAKKIKLQLTAAPFRHCCNNRMYLRAFSAWRHRDG